MPQAAIPECTATQSRVELQTTIPADLAHLRTLRERFEAFLTGIDVCAAERSTWLVVLAELVANAIRHGARLDPTACIRVAWSREPDAITLRVGDPGQGPPEGAFAEAHLPDDDAEGGRGLYLLHAFADEIQTMHGTRGFEVTVRRAHHAPTTFAPADDELEQILDELSTCYENLSAFHRLSQSLLHADQVEGFLDEALRDFTTLHPFDTALVIGASDLPSLLVDALAGCEWFRRYDDVSASSQGLLETHGERIWDTPEERGDGLVRPGARQTDSDTLFRGAAMPIVAGTTTFGMVLVGRTREGARMRSHTVSSLRTIADLFGIALANARMRHDRAQAQKSIRELEIAVEIQRQLLPLLPPPTSPAWRVTLDQESARGVAGDYVIATTNTRGDLVVATVDVMGKGVTAALLASIFRTAFELVRDVQPVEVLMQTLNRVLCTQVGEMTMFATCAVARIDKEGHWLEHANAGHCHTLLFDPSGAIRELEPSGPPLGLVPTMTYTSDRVLLRGGERIHFVSDGCYEFTEHGAAFGWPKLRACLHAHRTHAPSDVWELLRGRVRAAAGQAPLEDDCTLLTIDVTAARDTP